MKHAAAPPLDQMLMYRLHTLAKIVDRGTAAAYERHAGIAYHEGRCLAAVGAFGPLSVNGLAHWANLNKAPASRAAQSLVQQGLVRKTTSAADGRGVMLSLTAKGRRTWGRLMGVLEHRNAEITSCIEVSELQQLEQLLDRLIAHARSSARDKDDDANMAQR